LNKLDYFKIKKTSTAGLKEKKAKSGPCILPKIRYCRITTMISLSPNSVKKEISLYIITTCSNIQVVRIKEVITKDEMS